MNRRAWLASLLPVAADAVGRSIEQRVEKSLPPQRRPPGAISEAMFLSTCTTCGDCVEACPHAAIFTYTEEAGINAGTPVMLPDQRACHMCEDFPCAAACPEPSLSAPQEAVWSLGKVRIIEDRCIAFSGPECGACVGLCPGNVNALTQHAWRPKLDAEQCIGCGLCIEACPTDPVAIELEALRPAV